MRVFTSLVVIIVCLLATLMSAEEISEATSFQLKPAAKAIETRKRAEWKGKLQLIENYKNSC